MDGVQKVTEEDRPVRKEEDHMKVITCLRKEERGEGYLG